jgi:branched-chain amino acid transport system permease protein
VAEVLLAVLNGLIWGLIVALLAIGLVLTFGFLRIFNLAHGSFYMLGAILTFYATSRFKSFVLALVLVPFIVAAFGFVVERWLLRPVRLITNSDVLVTFALAMVMEYVVLVMFGGAPQRIPYPVTSSIPLLGSHYPVYRLVVACVSIVLLFAITIFLARTRFGLYVRASNQELELARGLGIPVNWVIFLTFGSNSSAPYAW